MWGVKKEKEQEEEQDKKNKKPCEHAAAYSIHITLATAEYKAKEEEAHR